jgi:chromatin remodeling complex protein RSC6
LEKAKEQAKKPNKEENGATRTEEIASDHQPEKTLKNPVKFDDAKLEKL